jgi:hypothetical protein
VCVCVSRAVAFAVTVVARSSKARNRNGLTGGHDMCVGVWCDVSLFVEFKLAAIIIWREREREREGEYTYYL